MPTRSSFRSFAVAASCLAMALVLYAASPLVTLWSMGMALQHDDVGTLRGALDWRNVRDGLKADLGSGASVSLASAHQTVPAEEELPDFGASFSTTIVSHVVDDVMTPEHLVGMLSHASTGHAVAPSGLAASLMSTLGRIQHVGFNGPARFEAAVRLADDPAAAPVTVSLQLRKWQWKVTRIHVPDQLLTGAGSNRT